MVMSVFMVCSNNNNNKQNCIASLGRNFRGAGARQRFSEQRKERKPGRRVMSLAQTSTLWESPLRTVFGSEFQTAGAEHRKACFANVGVVHVWHSVVVHDRRLCRDVNPGWWSVIGWCGVLSFPGTGPGLVFCIVLPLCASSQQLSGLIELTWTAFCAHFHKISIIRVLDSLDPHENSTEQLKIFNGIFDECKFQTRISVQNSKKRKPSFGQENPGLQSLLLRSLRCTRSTVG